jgi:hypothetical protein
VKGGPVAVAKKTRHAYPTHRQTAVGARPARESKVRPLFRYIEDELAARQWSERRFGIEADLTRAEVTAVLNGQVLTSSTLKRITRAFRASTELWESVELEVREHSIKKSGTSAW